MEQKKESENTVDLIQDRRRLRHRSRAALWRSSSVPAVRTCGRIINPAYSRKEKPYIEIIQGPDSKGWLGGLATCGSPWVCPRCSAVSAMRRSKEISNAAETCLSAGGQLSLLTLTLHHDSKDSLTDLWDGLAAGWRSVFGSTQWTGAKSRVRELKSGKAVTIPEVVGEKERFAVSGTMRVIECSYGDPVDGGHGWHLHAHVLLFSASPWHQTVSKEFCKKVLKKSSVTTGDCQLVASSILAASIFARWRSGVLKTGLKAPRPEGFDFRVIEDTANFVATYLSKSTVDVAAKIGAEVGSGVNTKVPKRLGNRTPFEILIDAVDAYPNWRVPVPLRWKWNTNNLGHHEIIDTETGQVSAVGAPRDWALWYQWEQASKGRRQILWSHRITTPRNDREELWNEILDSRPKADEDQTLDERTEVVALINRDEWVMRMANNPTKVTEMLEVVDSTYGGIDARAALKKWAEDNHVSVLETTLTTGFG